MTIRLSVGYAVLASELYDERDYIRDYDEFLPYIKDHPQVE